MVIIPPPPPFDRAAKRQMLAIMATLWRSVLIGQSTAVHTSNRSRWHRQLGRSGGCAQGGHVSESVIDLPPLTCNNIRKDPRDGCNHPGAWPDWLESNMSDLSAPGKVWSKLLKHRQVTPEGCWEWTAGRREGYGRVWLDGKIHTVHRVVASLTLGLDLADRWTLACHRCDNPPCFNPDHLFLGTPEDNNLDRDAKGRTRYAVGPRETIYPRFRPCDVCGMDYEPDADHRGRSRVCSASCLGLLRIQAGRKRVIKLDAQDIRQIRQLLASGVKGTDIADAWGVNKSTISMINTGKSHGHR